MNRINPLIKSHELDQFEKMTGDYRMGKTSSAQFVGERLMMGIYGQRQQGLMMVRTKIPAGTLYTYQLEGLADALERYSGAECLHITTRQDIQFYSVTLANSTPLLRQLARSDLSTREAGGNTIRNITSCPFAGVCPQRYVNVDHYIENVAQHFVRHPLTQALPRKFKISFSGCGHDCANGLAHDLGFIATRKNGVNGFKVMVGGGLGATPVESIVLTSFVPEAHLIPVIAAVVALHDKFSDRERRSRSRLKFVIKEWGQEKFLAQYRQEFTRALSAYNVENAYHGDWVIPASLESPPTLSEPLYANEGNLVSLPISPPQGQLSVQQLRDLSGLLKSYHISQLKLTMKQGFVLPEIDSSQIDALSLAKLRGEFLVRF